MHSIDGGLMKTKGDFNLTCLQYIVRASSDETAKFL